MAPWNGPNYMYTVWQQEHRAMNNLPVSINSCTPTDSETHNLLISRLKQVDAQHTHSGNQLYSKMC